MTAILTPHYPALTSHTVHTLLLNIILVLRAGYWGELLVGHSLVTEKHLEKANCKMKAIHVHRRIDEQELHHEFIISVQSKVLSINEDQLSQQGISSWLEELRDQWQ